MASTAFLDWRDIADDKEKYQAYLCSREWGELREEVRLRAGGKCERCKCNDMDAVHHLTYARKYHESLDDLQAICTGCHEFTHGKSNVDPNDRWHTDDLVLRPYRDAGGRTRGQMVACPSCSEARYSSVDRSVNKVTRDNEGFEVTSLGMTCDCGCNYQLDIWRPVAGNGNGGVYLVVNSTRDSKEG